MSAAAVLTAPTGIDSDLLRESRFPTARAAREQAAWLAHIELERKAPSTLYDYSWATDRLLEAFPNKDFADFTDEDLLYVLKRFPIDSVFTRAAAYRSWFKWGVKTRRRSDNPCDLLPDFRRKPQEVINVFTPAEELALENLPAPDGQLMVVLFEGGLRKSEAIHVRSRHFNLDRRELALREGTKGGKHRVVVISEKLATAVEELRVLEGLKPTDYLWYTKPGGGKARHDQPKVSRAMHEWWVRCLETAGVEHKKLHTTRHTYATRWRERGLPLDDLQMMLGHASIQTTSDLYVHTKVKDVRKRMELLIEDEG